MKQRPKKYSSLSLAPKINKGKDAEIEEGRLLIKEVMGIPGMGEVITKSLRSIEKGMDAVIDVYDPSIMAKTVWAIAVNPDAPPDVKLRAFQFLFAYCSGEATRGWLHTMAKIKEAMRTDEAPRIIVEVETVQGGMNTPTNVTVKPVITLPAETPLPNIEKDVAIEIEKVDGEGDSPGSGSA